MDKEAELRIAIRRSEDSSAWL